jgi:hypothetical protein
MRMVITIFNDDLEGTADVEARITNLCDVVEIVGACLYVPQVGMLAEFTELLTVNNIPYYYGVHLSRPTLKEDSHHII